MTLYSKSLEAHMRAYLKNAKLQDLNNQYQKAQHDIIRKSELMGLSQAETNNKLEELQNSLREQSGTAELVKQAKGAKLIPLSKTNAPEVVIPKEEYKPMTASEYENVLQKRYNQIGQLLPDFPAVPPNIEDIRPQKVKDILNLYPGEPKKQATRLLAEVIAVALNKAKKRDLNKTELNNAIQKNLNAVVDNPNINKNLFNELNNAIRDIKLKKTVPINSQTKKIKTLSPFQQELAKKIAQKQEEAIVKKNISSGKFVPSIEELKRKPKVAITQTLKERTRQTQTQTQTQTQAPSSSQATTASSQADISDMPTTASRGDNLTRSNAFRSEFKKAGIELPKYINKKGAISQANIDRAYDEYYNKIDFSI